MRNLTLGLLFLLCACSSAFEAHRDAVARNEEVNKVYPDNYKSDILALMRTYLNDPSNIREAGISEPMFKGVEGTSRYVVCIRYNAKKGGGQYAGSKENAILFREGRLDRMIDTIRDQREGRVIRELCKDAAVKPFPELERLSR